MREKFVTNIIINILICFRFSSSNFVQQNQKQLFQCSGFITSVQANLLLLVSIVRVVVVFVEGGFVFPPISK